MPKSLSRRRFLRLAAASGASAAGLAPHLALSTLRGQSLRDPLPGLPALDGSLAYDDETRRAFSTDHGNFLVHRPSAVLSPGSVSDIVRIVEYANRNRLKVAIRGQGHSRSGETLVPDGIVIDSRALRTVKVTARSVDAGPGALLGEVYEEAFSAGLTLPATPSCTELSVGGVLSAGGWGATSHRFGATVDSVQELDVVTGDGHLVTCSAQKESELFSMALAGLGQCALIVRARMGLVSAPADVVRQELAYDDLDACVADQTRLMLEGRFDHQTGRAIRKGDRWSFSIDVGKYVAASEAVDFSALTRDLRNNSRSEPTRTPYREYIGPSAAGKAASWPATRATRRLGDMVLFVPGSAVLDFTRSVLATLSASPFGPASFSFVPLLGRRFARPLFRLPDGDLIFSLWLFPRSVPANDTLAYTAMTAETRSLFEKAASLGGKCYIPHSSVNFSRSDWIGHYGSDTWKRLSSAKNRYDPNSVLNPGPGMFSGAA